MLHQIDLPAYVSILNGFIEFQKQLLEFACTPAMSEPLTEINVKQVFPGYKGDWLWGKLWKRDGAESELACDIKKVTIYIKSHPRERATILEAFEHDINFHLHIEDPDFQFHY